MNWEAIGAVGTLVGGVAVLLTLVYLSIQVRQNSQASLLTGLADITSRWHQWGQLLATSPDLARIVVQGNDSYARLSAEEALRYGAWAQTFFDIAETYHRLIEQIGLDEQKDVLASIIARRIRIPGMAECWLAHVEDYDPRFIDWVEAIRKSQCGPGLDRGGRDAGRSRSRETPSAVTRSAVPPPPAVRSPKSP